MASADGKLAFLVSCLDRLRGAESGSELAMSLLTFS